MPVEIRELHIKVQINNAENKSIPSLSGTGQPPSGEQEIESRIVAQCVEQIMEILKEKSER